MPLESRTLSDATYVAVPAARVVSDTARVYTLRRLTARDVYVESAVLLSDATRVLVRSSRSVFDSTTSRQAPPTPGVPQLPRYGLP